MPIFPRAHSCWVALALWLGSIAHADTASLPDNSPLRLLIQPIHSEAQTRRAYQPLAEYLAHALKREVTILAPPNPVAYWDLVRRGQGFDLAFDEAHFTDYRIQRHGFEVLVKAPETMSYSLVASESREVRNPMELVGKSIATLGLPSIGAVRLTAMFLNPARQPHILEVASAEEALELLTKNRAQAAILPTDYAREQMERGVRLRVVTTTEPLPNIALSAAPGIDAGTRERLRVLLLNAQRSPDGRRMLAAAGLSRFEPADAGLYSGHARVLQKYWGYEAEKR